jgi:glycine/D-amino acid oxidase-like deaminating enzyme
VGGGTSGRGFGTVSALGRRPASHLRLMLAAQAYMPELLDRLGRPDAYRMTGAVALIRDEADLEARRRLAEEQREVEGFEPPEVLDAAAVRSIAPALTGPLEGGVHRPQDGQVEPAILVEALHAAAIRDGVAVVEGARVDGMARADGTWRIATPVGTVEGRSFVNAAGVWAEGLGRLAGVSIPVRSVRGQVVVVDADGAAIGPTVTWAGRLDLRTAAGGRTWLGTVQQVDSWDLEVREDDTDAILGRVAELAPDVAMRPVREAWAGLRPVPADGLPLVGRVDGADDYFVAVGHGGLALCGVEGRGLAAEVAGGPVDPLLAPFDPARPIPGWQVPEPSAGDAVAGLVAGATRLGMRTDGTDWSRVATVAARSGAAGRRVADGAVGRPLRTRTPEWS